MCQVFVGEHGKGGGDGTDDPEGADQIFEHILEDHIVDENDRDRERAGERKGPGSPGGNEAQPTQHEADEHGAQQVADDVDEQVGRHDGIAVEGHPECGKLRGAAGPANIVGQRIETHERGPGNPADQGQRRRDGGEPGRTPHAKQRHAQIAQRQEKGGSDGTDEVQSVAGRTGHGAVDERLAEIALPGDEIERDGERREENADCKTSALEGKSRVHGCLF